MEKNHWLIRVGDGINFKNSIYSFWGLKPGRCNSHRTIVQKFRKGDIL